MTALIPLCSTPVNGATRQTVNARDLHAFLGSKQDFSTWVKGRIAQYGFAEDADYVVVPEAPQKNGASETKGCAQGRIDYHLTLDMAKELSMVERTPKGKEARAYFLECERRAMAAQSGAFAIPKTLPEALRLAADLAEQNAKQTLLIEDMTPKAEFHDRVTQSPDMMTVAEVAKILRTGPRRMFEFLRREGLLMRSNLPYQNYLDRGLFRVVESTWTDKFGRERVSTKTVVTQKGLQYIQGLQDRLAALYEASA